MICSLHMPSDDTIDHQTDMKELILNSSWRHMYGSFILVLHMQNCDVTNLHNLL